MVRKNNIFYFVLLTLLLLTITGCATSRIPSGPETFSTIQYEGKPKLGIIKAQDSRKEKKAGNIGLAVINVESEDLTNMVTNHLVHCVNNDLQFNVEKVGAYLPKDMNMVATQYGTSGTITLNVLRLELRSFDAILEPVETDIDAKVQVYDQEGKLVYEEIINGHYSERIGLSIVDKATGELINKATESLIKNIAINLNLRKTLTAL